MQPNPQSDFTGQIQQHLGHRFKYALAILPGYFQDLDAAINMYNSQTAEFKPYLENARFLRNEVRVKTLPALAEMLTADLEPEFWELMAKFDFIDQPWPSTRMAPCIVVAAYRCWCLVRNPDWRAQKAQVASTIEEMLAQMAINGQVTVTFYAVKPWIEDYQEEGFAVELAQRIKNL